MDDKSLCNSQKETLGVDTWELKFDEKQTFYPCILCLHLLEIIYV